MVFSRPILGCEPCTPGRFGEDKGVLAFYPFQTVVLAAPPGRRVVIAAFVEERRSEQAPCRDRGIFEDT